MVLFLKNKLSLGEVKLFNSKFVSIYEYILIS